MTLMKQFLTIHVFREYTDDTVTSMARRLTYLGSLVSILSSCPFRRATSTLFWCIEFFVLSISSSIWVALSRSSFTCHQMIAHIYTTFSTKLLISKDSSFIDISQTHWYKSGNNWVTDALYHVINVSYALCETSN